MSSASDLSDQIFSNVIVCVCFVAEAARTSEAKSPKHRMLIEHDVKRWPNSLWSSLRWRSSSPVAVRLFYSVHLPRYTNGIKQSQRLLFSALYCFVSAVFRQLTLHEHYISLQANVSLTLTVYTCFVAPARRSKGAVCPLAWRLWLYDLYISVTV